MVLTKEKLELQVTELQKQYNGLVNSLGNNVMNYIIQYQSQMTQIKAKIDLVHNQIGELVKEEQKAKKEMESKNKQEVKK